MPVFFIQDGIKFPDLIHAAKPEPDREIPQAQTAHDTFWDFASLAAGVDPHADVDHVGPGHPPVLSDHGGIRGPHLPPRQRQGQDDVGQVPLEAGWRAWPRWCGRNPRSWAGSTRTSTAGTCGSRIEVGAFPEWDLGIQVFPDTDDQTFEGIDLLDATKLVPEELAPVRRSSDG